MLEKLDISKIPQEIPEALRRAFSGQVPSPAEFVDKHLAALTVVQAAVLLAVGVIFLIYGWQAFRLLVIANGAFIGGIAGAYVASTYVGKDMALFGLLGGGLLLAVLVVPMIRYVVTIGGGLIGCYAGYRAWPNVMRAVEHAEVLERVWIGGLVGALAVGVLCFLCFRVIIMVLTSVEGGMLVISGAVGLCLHTPLIAERIRQALIGNRYALPVLFTVPTVIGFALQYNAFRHPPRPQSSQSGGSEKEAGAAA